jgi:hypothetical protein
VANCVAFYIEPETRQSRFIVQGDVDRDEIAKAVQSLIDLLDTIDGDADLEDDDPDHEHDGREPVAGI